MAPAAGRAAVLPPLDRGDGETGAGVELGGGARGYRMGARFRLGPAFELELEGERRESRTERTGHGVMLRGRMRW